MFFYILWETPLSIILITNKKQPKHSWTHEKFIDEWILSVIEMFKYFTILQYYDCTWYQNNIDKEKKSPHLTMRWFTYYIYSVWELKTWPNIMLYPIHSKLLDWILHQNTTYI